jgi:hypothetical protein
MYNNSQIFLITQKQLQETIEVIIEKQINNLKLSLASENCYLNRCQAAKEVGKNPNTISRWIKNGKLINRGLGKQILISKNDLLGINARRSDYSEKKFIYGT